MSSLLIVDGFSLAFRAFYAYPLNLTSPDGQPVNALYGFVTLLLNAVESLDPTHLCVCFDLPEPTFRHKRYDAYKANRSAAPEEFKPQIGLIKSFLDDVGIRSCSVSGYEADDVMGVLAVKGAAEKMDVFLFTGDQDAFQLVNDYVHVVMPQKGQAGLKVYDRQAVYEKSGVFPEQIIDFKALKGDASDNIPGVKGIGDKTAAKLLHQFKTLRSLYDDLDCVAPLGVQNKLSADREMAFLSLELATLCLDFDVSVSVADLQMQLDWDMMGQLFQTYAFNRLIKKYEHEFSGGLPPTTGKSAQVFNYDVVVIDSVKALKELLPLLKQGFAFDLETTSLSVHDACCVGVSLCCSSDKAFYIPLKVSSQVGSDSSSALLFNVSGGDTLSVLTMPALLAVLKPVFEDASVVKIAHHIKYDCKILWRYGITLQGVLYDSMLAAFLLFPLDRVGLKELALTHFSVSMTAFEDIVPKGKSFQDVDLKVAAEYAGADAFYTYQLMQLFQPLLEEKQLWNFFVRVECPLTGILARMEFLGVCLDLEKINTLRDSISTEQEGLRKELFSLMGTEFNLNSPKQLADVLFDTLGLPVIKKTKTGRSTDASVLEALTGKHACIERLILYRTNEKLLSTYINALPHLVHPKTGRVHTSFNQSVVITGRLSSSAPNLQNIPVRTEKGLELRSVFVPSGSDRVLVAIDYSQVELRLMAHFSKDQAMMDAFHHGQDIHQATAALLFQCDEAAVTKEQRYQAKAVNFGIIYGISAFGLSKNIHSSRQEAQQLIDHYFKMFPGVKAFMDETIETAKKNGFVQTAFGRLRPLPNIVSGNRTVRHFEERAAVNTLLQGTAADIMKMAMIQVSEGLKKASLDADLILQVHDELVFDVLASDLEALVILVKTQMESVVQYRVPLLVDVEYGKNWKNLDLFEFSE